MRKLSNREQWIAGVCIAVCLFMFVKQVVIARFLDYGAVQANRIEVLADKIANAENLLSKNDSYDRKLQQLAKDLGQVSSEGREMTQVSTRIEEIARQVNVRIINLQPVSIRKEKFFVIYPVEIILDGDWKGIAMFIHSLQSSETSLRIEEMQVENNFGQVSSLKGRIVASWIRLNLQSKS